MPYSYIPQTYLNYGIFVCFFIELSLYKAEKVVPESLFIFLHLLLSQSDDTKANDGNEEIVGAY